MYLLCLVLYLTSALELIDSSLIFVRFFRSLASELGEAELQEGGRVKILARL